MARTIGDPAAAFALALSLSLVLAPPAEARGGGGHGFGRGFHGGRGSHGAMYGGGSAGDRRHASDDYVKAASAERERLLNTQIKSICRGCWV
jgi:hypothetical protein